MNTITYKSENNIESTNDEVIQLATTINQQLRCGRQGIAQLWSWGISKRYAIKPSDLNSDTKHLGGLLLKVNGMKHKGHVLVRLALNDTYIVDIGRNIKSKSEFKSKKQFTNVYCDNLADLIDYEIESN